MRVRLIIPPGFNEINRQSALEAARVQLVNPELKGVHRIVEGFGDLEPGSRVAVEVSWDKERENLVAQMVIV